MSSGKNGKSCSDKELNDELDDKKEGSLAGRVKKLQDLQARLWREEKYLSPADEADLSKKISQLNLATFESKIRGYEAKYLDKGKVKKPVDDAGNGSDAETSRM